MKVRVKVRSLASKTKSIGNVYDELGIRFANMSLYVWRQTQAEHPNLKFKMFQNPKLLDYKQKILHLTSHDLPLPKHRCTKNIV
jgi:hypothetical protein